MPWSVFCVRMRDTCRSRRVFRVWMLVLFVTCCCNCEFSLSVMNKVHLSIHPSIFQLCDFNDRQPSQTGYLPELVPPSAWQWLLGEEGAWLCWSWLNHWCHDWAVVAALVEQEALKWVGLYWGEEAREAQWPLSSHLPGSGRTLLLDAHLCEQTGAAAGCSYFWIACCRWHRYEQHGLDELVAFLGEDRQSMCWCVFRCDHICSI